MISVRPRRWHYTITAKYSANDKQIVLWTEQRWIFIMKHKTLIPTYGRRAAAAAAGILSPLLRMFDMLHALCLFVCMSVCLILAHVDHRLVHFTLAVCKRHMVKYVNTWIVECIDRDQWIVYDATDDWRRQIVMSW